MADRLRLVNLRWPKPPAVLADLAQGLQMQLSKDTLKLAPGDPGAILTAAPTRWGGSRVVGELRANATLSATFLVIGTTKDGAIQTIAAVLESALAANAPDMAIEWRPDGATYSTYFRLRGAPTYAPSYSWAEFQSANMIQIDLAFPVAPTGEPPPYDIFDDFSVDTVTLGDWIWDGGSNTTVSVQGGSLVPSGVSDHGPYMRYRHARGIPYGDVEVAFKLTTGSVVTSGVWGLTLGADMGGADTMLELVLATTTGQYNLYKVAAGSLTSLGTPQTLAPAANTSYYFLLRRAGNVLYWRVSTSLNWVEYAVEPNTYTLVGADLRFAAPGHVGFRIAPASTGERYDDYSARPFTYRGIQTPEHVQLIGPIIGDAPAMADIEVTPIVGASTAPAIFGRVGWCERPQVPNLCTGGNLTDVRTNFVANGGWVATAVSGVIAAATSAGRGTSVTPPKYGGSSLTVTCPATTDTGTSFLVSRRFKRGKVYAAIAWLAAATATTNARLKLGVSGDLATETAQALSTGWKLHAAVWQPTADHDAAYVAAGISAATASVFDVNGVNVVEAPTVTLAAAISSTTATSGPVWYTPTEIPGLNPDGSLSTPFLALIDLELVRVTAISGTTWTFDRGQEGTVAATHAVDAYVIVLPPSRQQYEGKGALPAFGVLDGEYNFTGTIVSSTSARGGLYSTSSGTLGQWYIDPSSIPPDDFADDDVLVSLWARVWLDPAATGMVITPIVNSSEKYDPTNTASLNAGATRYTLERGSAGFVQGTDFTAPSGSGGTLVPQYLLLGTLPLVADRTRPQRWLLTINYASTGGANPGIDYAELAPARGFIATETGDPDDTNYASFVPNRISANAITMTCMRDGSALIRVPRLSTYTQPDAFPAAGLGQSIDLPNADLDLAVKLSNLVPNDPTSNTAEMFSGEPFWTCGIHAALQPRVTTLRGS